MKDRFCGTENRETLIDALLEQRVVEHDRSVAEKLADAGEVVEFKVGDVITKQGASENDVYLILDGRFLRRSSN